MKPRVNLKLSQKGLILVSVPLAFELLLIGLLVWLLQQAEAEIKREMQARTIISRANTSIEKILTIAAGGAVFNMASGKQEPFAYEKSLAEIPRELSQLAYDLRFEEERARSAEACVSLWHKAAADAIQLKRAIADGDQIIAMQRFHRLQRLIIALTGNLHKIVHEEEPQQEKSIRNQAQLRQQVSVLLAVAVPFNIGIAIALAYFFNKGTISRLHTVLDNTMRLGAGQKLNPMLEGTDEIAEVDKVFHSMAYELKKAADKERALLEQAIASENRTRMIIDSMPVGLLILDGRGAIKIVNPATEKMLGFQSSELEHLRISDLLTDLGTQSPDEYTAQLFQKATGHICEKSARRRSGDEFPIQLTITGYESDAASLSGENQNLFLGIMLDLTERQEIMRLKREFVSIVSHELRTPVTSVRAFFSLLKAGAYGSLNDVGVNRLDSVDSNMERLIRLINDLLQAEKLDFSNLELEIADHTVEDVVTRSINEVKELADHNEVVLQARVTDAPIQADRDRLIQVMVNLLSNAIKYSPRGGIVEIATRKNGRFMKVSVSDQGPGIPEEHLEAIFERFHQVSRADSKVKGGTGLGLAIARAIVTGHGGEISVESEKGKGSTFWFTLPL